MATGIYKTANTHLVADFVFGDFVADGGDSADNFMARHHGIHRTSPFPTDLMDVGMADAAVLNIDGNIVRAGIAPLKGIRRQWSLCAGSRDTSWF